MWKRKKEKPIRLDKKVTKKEKIQRWFSKYKMSFVVAGIVVALIIFVVLIIKFAPGTESGEWYNGFKGVI